MSLGYILYRSNASIGVGGDDIFSIIQSSARNNPVRQVTGFLVFSNSFFLQYLEGRRGNLLELMEVLRCDPRHSGIEILSEGKVDDRVFPSWTMQRWMIRNGDSAALRAALEQIKMPLAEIDEACGTFKQLQTG